MKKYRLKKDLPIAKAGTIIRYSKDADYNAYLIDKKDLISRAIPDSIIGVTVFFDDDVERLISEGWIEEVLPREFEIALNKSGIAIAVSQPGNTTVLYPDSAIEKIKVREVTDEQS